MKKPRVRAHPGGPRARLIPSSPQNTGAPLRPCPEGDSHPLPLPSGSFRKAFFSVPAPLCRALAPLGTRGGSGEGQPRLPQDKGEPHYSGLARNAWLLAPSDSTGDVPGLPPSALRDLPYCDSLNKAPGRCCGLEVRSVFLHPGRETRAAPEAWEAHLPARWQLQGGKVRAERSLSSPEPGAPALPVETRPARQRGVTTSPRSAASWRSRARTLPSGS